MIGEHMRIGEAIRRGGALQVDGAIDPHRERGAQRLLHAVAAERDHRRLPRTGRVLQRDRGLERILVIGVRDELQSRLINGNTARANDDLARRIGHAAEAYSDLH